MLTIYTKKDSCKKIIDVESRFRMLIRDGETFSNDAYTKIMKKIDNISERRGNIITSRFGETLIESLSSGCKAVLLAVYYHDSDIAVSVDECGENALKVLFKIAEKINLQVYVSNYIKVNESDIECIVSDKLCKGGYAIYQRLGALNE